MTTLDPHPTIIGTLRSMSKPVRVLLWGMFISNLTAFLNLFLVLFLTASKHMSAYHAGIALGVLLAGRILGTTVGGALAEWVGYRWTTAISMLGNAVGIAALVHVNRPWQAIALSGLIGIIGQAFRPASQAWLMDLTPPERHVMLFSIYRLTFNVGTVVGPLAAAVLVQYSYALLFYVDAATALAFAVLALAVLPDDRPARKTPARGGKHTAGVAPAAHRPKAARGGRLQVFKDGPFLLVVFGLFLTAISYIQLTAALPLFVTGTGHPAQVYAVLLALNGILVIGLEMILTKGTQLLPIRIPMAGGMILLGVGHLLYLVPAGLSALAVATVVWTLGEIVAAPSMLAYPGRVAPPELRARYVAAATAPQQAGYALGPLVGVAAWQLWGSGVWVITGVIALVAAVFTLAGAKNVPGPETESAETAAPAGATPAGAAPPDGVARPAATEVNQRVNT